MPVEAAIEDAAHGKRPKVEASLVFFGTTTRRREMATKIESAFARPMAVVAIASIEARRRTARHGPTMVDPT